MSGVGSAGGHQIVTSARTSSSHIALLGSGPLRNNEKDNLVRSRKKLQRGASKRNSRGKEKQTFQATKVTPQNGGHGKERKREKGKQEKNHQWDSNSKPPA